MISMVGSIRTLFICDLQEHSLTLTLILTSYCTTDHLEDTSIDWLENAAALDTIRAVVRA